MYFISSYKMNFAKVLRKLAISEKLIVFPFSVTSKQFHTSTDLEPFLRLFWGTKINNVGKKSCKKELFSDQDLKEKKTTLIK